MNYLEKFYDILGKEKGDQFWLSYNIRPSIHDIGLSCGWEKASQIMEEWFTEHENDDVYRELNKIIIQKTLQKMLLYISEQRKENYVIFTIEGTWGLLETESFSTEVNQNYFALLSSACAFGVSLLEKEKVEEILRNIENANSINIEFVKKEKGDN